MMFKKISLKNRGTMFLSNPIIWILSKVTDAKLNAYHVLFYYIFIVQVLLLHFLLHKLDLWVYIHHTVTVTIIYKQVKNIYAPWKLLKLIYLFDSGQWWFFVHKYLLPYFQPKHKYPFDLNIFQKEIIYDKMWISLYD